jgi:hypothetical protein
MSEQSDTPETDSFVQDHDFKPLPHQCLNLASRFERERNEARREVKSLQDDLVRLTDTKRPSRETSNKLDLTP